MDTLQRKIQIQLQAGALVIIVESDDEVLAAAAASMAVMSLPNQNPPTNTSAIEPDFLTVLAKPQGAGTRVVIARDLLGSNPTAFTIRMVREWALQQHNPPYPRLILIEIVGTKIPATLKGDVVVVKEDPLTYKDYGHELESFLHDQGIPKPEEAEKKAIVEAFSGITRSQAARIMALCFVTQKKLDADWIKNYLESQK